MNYPIRAKRGPNLAPDQRIVSMLAGAGLFLYAARKSKIVRIPLMLGSGFLIFRSATGRDPVAQALGVYREDDRTTAVRVQRAITVNRPRNEVYAFWRDFSNLPRFMQHLQSVEYTAGMGFSHWVAKAPLGMNVEWDAQMVEDRPDELIVWQSLPGSMVGNAGRVMFQDAMNGTGTEVIVDFKYNPPLGTTGVVIGRLAGEEPFQQVREDLRRFKRIMETGEVISTEGQPSGPVTNGIVAQIKDRMYGGGKRNTGNGTATENHPENEILLEAASTNDHPLDTFSSDDRSSEVISENVGHPAGKTTRARKPRKGSKVE